MTPEEYRRYLAERGARSLCELAGFDPPRPESRAPPPWRPEIYGDPHPAADPAKEVLRALPALVRALVAEELRRLAESRQHKERHHAT